MEETVRVADRIFDILEQLAQAGTPLSLGEIAERTGISKTTAHRLLATMCARQYVEKRSNGSYTIGYKMIETVSTHINGLELLTESRPYLNQVVRDLELTSHMGILDGNDVVYIEKMDMYPNTRLYTRVGYRSPAFCSSIGKCLLACLSGDEQDEFLYNCSFKKYTSHTITDPREFKRVLRIIRKQGWAMDNEEYQEGHRCIGAPIFDYRGSAVAAISASGSIHILTDERLESVIREVKEAAAAISRRMGYVE